MLKLFKATGPSGMVHMSTWIKGEDLDIFATAYLAGMKEQPDNTRENHFAALNTLRIACKLYDIYQFDFRMSYGIGVDRALLRRINEAFNYKKKDLQKVLERKKTGADLFDIATQLNALPPAETSTIKNRKIALRRYLNWLLDHGDRVLRNYHVSPEETAKRKQLRANVEEVVVVARQASFKLRSKLNPYDLLLLEDFMESYDFRDVWKEEVTGLRNKVMFDLQFYGTLRTGEVLLLKHNDTKPGRRDYPNEIRIEDRRNDPEETRIRRPAVKTGAGVVTVPEPTFKLIEEWKDAFLDIEDDALELGLHHRMEHNFMFVNTSRRMKKYYGRPLTISGYNFAFKSLCEAAGIKGRLGPHALRHLCAMRYVRRRKQQGNSNDIIIRDMCQFFRWSRTSDMPKLYSAHENHASLYEAMEQD